MDVVRELHPSFLQKGEFLRKNVAGDFCPREKMLPGKFKISCSSGAS
jgi:hypothetical protein